MTEQPSGDVEGGGRERFGEWDLNPQEREHFERMKAVMLEAYPQMAWWFEGSRRAEVVFQWAYMSGQNDLYREQAEQRARALAPVAPREQGEKE